MTATGSSSAAAMFAVPRMRVHTLAFKNKLRVPTAVLSSAGASVAQLREWVANTLNFPVAEAQLIAAGQKLDDTTLLVDLAEAGTLDVFLVCRSPSPASKAEAERSGADIKIFVQDTTRTPNKMYAVKMGAAQTATELKEKIFTKSSCKVPPSLQQLTCRGKIVDNSFSLREFTISQRRHRIVFYLSKDPNAAHAEELGLTVVVPRDGVQVKVDLRANQTIGNLRQALLASYGIRPDNCSLLNSYGLVLQDDMSVRTAITAPALAPVRIGAVPSVPVVSAAPPATNLMLYAVAIAPERLTRGLVGVHVYLNPAQLPALGVGVDVPARPTLGVAQGGSSSESAPAKRRKSRHGSACVAADDGTKATKGTKGSNVLKGFRGLFNKKKSLQGKAPAEKDSDDEEADVDGTVLSKQVEKAKRSKPKKKKQSGAASYKSRMRAMMSSSRYSSPEDEVEQYRAKLGHSLGGGAYKRVDSI